MPVGKRYKTTSNVKFCFPCEDGKQYPTPQLDFLMFSVQWNTDDDCKMKEILSKILNLYHKKCSFFRKN